MTIGQSMLPEFDQRWLGTRKTLALLARPEVELEATRQSGTVGWLAGHIATCPGGSR